VSDEVKNLSRDTQLLKNAGIEFFVGREPLFKLLAREGHHWALDAEHLGGAIGARLECSQQRRVDSQEVAAIQHDLRYRRIVRNSERFAVTVLRENLESDVRPPEGEIEYSIQESISIRCPNGTQIRLICIAERIAFVGRSDPDSIRMKHFAMAPNVGL